MSQTSQMSQINMERQASLGLQLPKAVAVVGAGGVGSWTALFLAMAGVRELWLFDNDTVSDHNLNRLPLPLSAVGKPKTMAIAEQIRTLRPDCNVMTMGYFDEQTAQSLSLHETVQWIVATTDTLSSRRTARKWAAEHNVEYIEAAAEGEIGSATGEPAGWSTPEDEHPGYASVPVWISPCVTSAIAAVSHIVHNQPMGDRTVRMGWQQGQFHMYDSEAGRSKTVVRRQGAAA